jgi:hypothetical protein
MGQLWDEFIAIPIANPETFGKASRVKAPGSLSQNRRKAIPVLVDRPEEFGRRISTPAAASPSLHFDNSSHGLRRHLRELCLFGRCLLNDLQTLNLFPNAGPTFFFNFHMK